ncbi:MAG: serine/threonine-protein kinase, partial [Planctomycetota bacterium]|nr:serine/threonine-protein kinase [Planctomycetota bacterium]
MSQKPLKNPLPKIDGYLIEGVLGRGATGVVYSAVQLAVDRPVAIKVLHTQLMGSKSAVRRLQREARTAARLAHPGIISAIDMGEQDGLWWYAMELVEGISLGERVDERGPLSERDALRFFLPLVEALQHAFEAGVVHRDIKPSNILIDSHGKARLVDLGLAFAEDDPMVTKPGGT